MKIIDHFLSEVVNRTLESSTTNKQTIQKKNKTKQNKRSWRKLRLFQILFQTDKYKFISLTLQKSVIWECFFKRIQMWRWRTRRRRRRNGNKPRWGWTWRDREDRPFHSSQCSHSGWVEWCFLNIYSIHTNAKCQSLQD